MTTQTTYSDARANFASLWDRAVEDRETVIVKRRGKPDLAMIAADELASLEETAYLLRSPANAKRLFAALDRADRGETLKVSDEAFGILMREVKKGSDLWNALERAGLADQARALGVGSGDAG